MSRKEMFQAIALVVMLASMPFYLWGANDESVAVVVVATVLLAAGALALTALRFVKTEEE